MTILVSPAERAPALVALGKLSSLPEKWGADFCWFANGKKWGVQRKEIADLLASVDDGRLTKELGQMAGMLDRAVVVLEGQTRYSTDGVLLDAGKGKHGYGRAWTFAEIQGVLVSIQTRGVWVLRSGSIGETALSIAALEKWSRKKTHSGLMGREAMERSAWGRATNREFNVHLLTGIPGLGPEIAGRVVEHFDGLPWRWECSEEQLLEVPGVGAKRAKMMMAALNVPGEFGFPGG